MSRGLGARLNALTRKRIDPSPCQQPVGLKH